MRRTATVKEVVPNPARLINSLRDFGYELTQAVADLVDNSLDAGATEVRVDVQYDAERSWIRVVDNGKGMTPDELTEAMRYGAERDYEGDDKGKFGLGLKTSSLSQCRRVSVATRMARGPRTPEIRVLDLDHVMQTRRWEIFTASDAANLQPPEFKKASSGTVVLWENLDRILQYKNPQGKRASDGILRHAENIEAHLAMVFHRFLSGAVKGRRKVSMWINDQLIEPWDPFATNERHTQKLREEEFEVASKQGKGVVLYRPFLLPTKRQFSSPAQFARLAGPEKWNLQQGLYIYRSDRLIQCGGWCRMAVVDEHTKFARAALEFRADLDDAFEINVTKTAIKLPSDLREDLDKHLRKLRELAKNAYKKNGGADEDAASGSKAVSGGKKVGTSVSPPAPSAPPVVSGGRSPAPPRGVPQPAPGPSTRSALERSATKVGETKALRLIVKELKASYPEVANELGW